MEYEEGRGGGETAEEVTSEGKEGGEAKEKEKVGWNEARYKKREERKELGKQRQEANGAEGGTATGKMQDRGS